jgi:hypothetical protein
MQGYDVPHDRLRDVIRSELEATREAFYALVASISDGDFRQPSLNPAWTVGEVLFHMSLAPRMLAADVRILRRPGRYPRLLTGLLNAIRPVFDALNVLYARLGARRLTRRKLIDKYDAGHTAALRALAMVAEDSWDKGLDYPNWDPQLAGHVTIERLFRYPKAHFEAHAEEVRRALERK